MQKYPTHHLHHTAQSISSEPPPEQNLHLIWPDAPCILTGQSTGSVSHYCHIMVRNQTVKPRFFVPVHFHRLTFYTAVVVVCGHSEMPLLSGSFLFSATPFVIWNQTRITLSNHSTDVESHRECTYRDFVILLKMDRVQDIPQILSKWTYIMVALCLVNWLIWNEWLIKLS